MADITEGTKEIEFTYGSDDQRRKSVYSVNSTVEKTIVYGAGFDKITDNSGTRYIHYIDSPNGLAAIIIKNGANETVYFPVTDHLGSILGLVNQSCTSLVEEYSFDSWGKRRNPNNWSYSNIPTPTLLTRGYTGHEHLDEFGLINMPARRSFSEGGNGRVYDPIVGRFLSPDNYVQMPFSTQAYNRYAYVLNNPIAFTDPSGYIYKAMAQPPAPSDDYYRRGGGGGIGSLWPIMGVLGGPMNSLEWDIMYGMNLAIAGYGTDYLRGVYSGLINGEYGITGSAKDRIINSINNQIASRASGRNSAAGNDYSVKVLGHDDLGGMHLELIISPENSIFISYNPSIPQNTCIVFNTLINGVPSGGEGSNQWNYNEFVAFGMTAAGSTSNLIGTTAEYTVYEMRALSAAKAAKAGVNGVKAVSTGASIVGGGLSYGLAGYEYMTGQANTHTFVDVGVTTLGFIAVGVGVIVAAPEIAVGAAVVGLGYGIASAC